jgi:CRP-like cAMP-binding protein
VSVVDSFLAALSDSEARDLAPVGHARRYARGRPVLYQGQVGEEVVILRSGPMKVVGQTADGREPIIAGSTGSSIEAVVKALGTMRRLGWVQTGRRSITVHDLGALRTAAR